MDYILNGQAHGTVGQRLLGSGMDVGALRPYIGKDGRTYITRNQFNPQTQKVEGKAQLVQNAAATLRWYEWLLIDQTVIQAARARLRVVADLRGAGLQFTVNNGMAYTSVQSAVIGDITGATISMDPARKSEGDRPEFDLVNIPLPIIHKDFYFNMRELAVARNVGTPLDTTMVELAGKRVAEEAEKLTLGVTASYTYGGGTIYGLTNFPQRITAVLTAPTHSAWTPQLFINEVLGMRDSAAAQFQFGPWVVYTSPNWDKYLDADYSNFKGNDTLRQRLLAIDTIKNVFRSDWLTGYQVIMVQQTSDTIRMIIGMDVTTIQWETEGGMRQNFKVMTIMVPQIRADANGRNGIIHGTAV
jgi:uncharacterized linocin/CFP29 family protein